jgi:hypothetical protein
MSHYSTPFYFDKFGNPHITNISLLVDFLKGDYLNMVRRVASADQKLSKATADYFKLIEIFAEKTAKDNFEFGFMALEEVVEELNKSRDTPYSSTSPVIKKISYLIEKKFLTRGKTRGIYKLSYGFIEKIKIGLRDIIKNRNGRSGVVVKITLDGTISSIFEDKEPQKTKSVVKEEIEEEIAFDLSFLPNDEEQLNNSEYDKQEFKY